jgi:tRNA pseudouridine55 synthase
MKAKNRGAEIHGVLVVDKPEGPTSHDVVDRARWALETRRIGHTGTLDPFATGVLPLCVGKATRLARFLSAATKEYRATVRFGFATTTDDRTGEPLATPREVALDDDEAAVRAACARFVGDSLQLPPAYSAKRVGGRRLHEMARAGVPVERAAAPVTIHAIEVKSLRGDRLEIHVRCSAGTYVRALARDLGEALGVGGHLESLRRTSVGSLGLEGAVTWAELTPDATGRLRPLSALLAELPSVTVDLEALPLLRHGRDLDRSAIREGFPEGQPPERVRVLGSDGALLALAVPRGFRESGSGLPREPVFHPDVVLLE